FLYTNNTLISIVNGIGKTTLSFIINSASLGIRIASVLLFIPVLGIQGYLWGMLASQLCIFLFCLIYLNYYLKRERE
ncbi:MAG: polysaccharide biosynthesis C-terminal domain-containing protein, partial [[Clostridium] scindens]